MKIKILVIENELDIIENIKLILKAENFEVIVATNGFDGIKFAKIHNPDLILCDIMMPGLDGYEVLNELLKDEKLDSTPFIFLTAKAEKEDFRKAMVLGADDYIFKPFTYAELVNSINIRLAKQKKIIEKVTVNKDDTSNNHQDQIEYDKNILIKYRKNIISIKINKIKFIRAENQYSKLVFDNNKEFLMKKSMTSWEKILPLKFFIRVHRSNLVNVNFIEKIITSKDRAIILLKNFNDEINVSRRYLKKLSSSFIKTTNIIFVTLHHDIVLSFEYNLFVL